MLEIEMLHVLLLAAMALAPIVTSRFLLDPSTLFSGLHAGALVLTGIALVLDVPLLTFAWLFFCLVGLGRYAAGLYRERSRMRITQGVPFVFAVVGAVWLVSGANGFGLLNYDKSFSYYAALHSHFLGWMIVGSIAALATHATRFNRLYVASVFGCLGSFFLIAFGIDGVAVIKPIGVVGITVFVGGAQLLFLTDRGGARWAYRFGLLSVLGFSVSMLLAWMHELGSPLTVGLLGVRPMVSFHGIINGFLVAPAMLIALHVRFPKKRGEVSSHLSPKG